MKPKRARWLAGVHATARRVAYSASLYLIMEAAGALPGDARQTCAQLDPGVRADIATIRRRMQQQEPRVQRAASASTTNTCGRTASRTARPATARADADPVAAAAGRAHELRGAGPIRGRCRWRRRAVSDIDAFASVSGSGVRCRNSEAGNDCADAGDPAYGASTSAVLPPTPASGRTRAGRA